MSNSKKAVVFAGDYAYIRQIETAIKSLVYHNTNLKIYVFNQDIPKEWFSITRLRLERIGNELVDVKLLGAEFAMNWSNKLPHINHMTFARYFIPQFVVEDKALYLDSDLIVTKDLTELFELDLEDNYVAASKSCFGLGIGFNAGVLVINNALWKREKITDVLVETTNKEHQNVNEGDQSILNMVFKGRVHLLENTYNFQIGFDQGAAEQGHRYLFDILLSPLPAILHFISSDKPWKTFSVGRLRDVWWHYNELEWGEITEHWKNLGVSEVSKTLNLQLTCFTLTDSYLLEQIETLVMTLPEVHFIISAYTMIAPDLLKLSGYPNVTLYPNDFPILIEKRLSQVDLYLDINHHGKIQPVYDLLDKYGIPKLAFDNTRHPEMDYSDVISRQEPHKMVDRIRKFIDR